MAEKKYIELQKALNVCEMHYQHCLEMHDWNGDTTADNIMRDIETIPTADVVEVKHGEWLPVQYTYFGLKRYECSECKDDEYWQKRYLEHKEKYCPNCGAKMDGKALKEREKE